MSEKKSIYEEALLDAKKIQEALKAKTKEILRSVAREEIDGMMNESLEEESDYEEEDVADDSAESTETPETDTEVDVDVDSEDGEEEVDIDSDNVGGETENPMDLDDAGSEEMPDEFSSDEIDLTGSSDDDVIAIYKKLSGEDEIEIVGDKIHLNVSEPGEYIIDTNSLESDSSVDDLGAMDAEVDAELPSDSELPSDDVDGLSVDMSDEDGEEDVDANEWENGLTYEIEMDDEAPSEEEENQIHESENMEADEESEETIEETEEVDEEPLEEAIPVGLAQSKRVPAKADIGQPKGAGAKSVDESAELKKQNQKLIQETAKLKKENEEFKKALKEFRNMLVETVLFNSNLSYVTKLFMEHSTTKDEKKTIIKRFDENVSTLKESKNLYKTIANELKERKVIKESIDSKKEMKSSHSQVLSESRAYVDPSVQRIMELINYRKS